MEKSKNIFLSSCTVEIAENERYLELTNRLCYYDDINLNNVMLPYKGCEESALEFAKSLINMPVQAKYKKVNNLDDLGSHEVYQTPEGEVYFLTESIGVHTDVWIAEATVTTVSGETKTLPCLFAKCRIWKRNPNVIAAIKRLYSTNGGLNSSWEISVLNYEFAEGVKILKDYSFLANTFLGSNVTPAYNGTSKTLSLSALNEQELMVAEALTIDLMENQGKVYDIDNTEEKEEKNNLKKDKNVISSEASVEETPAVETPDVPKTEEQNTANENVPEVVDENNAESQENSSGTSNLTDWDIKNKIEAALPVKYKASWVSYLFPEKHEAWIHCYDSSETDYLRVTYTIDGDNVTISEPEQVKLTVSVSEINDKVAEYEKTIAEKDEIIVKSSAEITSLKAENTELSQYKDKFEKAEQEKVEAELLQKKNDLIDFITSSKLITKEEIESSEELKGYVDNLDKKSLMALIGERSIASIENNKGKNETPEVAEANLQRNLNCGEEVDAVSIMKNYLNM